METTTFAHGGSGSGYAHHDCRCPECTAANSRRQTRARRARYLRFAADPTIAPHGSANTYRNYGCRCSACLAAHLAKKAETRERRRASA